MIEVYEKKLQDVINPNTEIQELAANFHFTEGPVWDSTNSRLIFSDITGDTMFQYEPSQGIKVFRQPSNFANGLALDGNGFLIVCEHRTRRVTRLKGGKYSVLADGYQGKRLNSPNDVIVAKDGSIIFSDPTYGLREGLGGPAEQDLDFQGVFRIVSGQNEPKLLADDFEAPNGLIISPDQNTLYVNDTVRRHIRTFQIGPEWVLKGGEILITLEGTAEGKPDGMKMDTYGNIYCTGPGGIWIIDVEGNFLGRVCLTKRASNMAWGDDDLRSLYVTAGTSLYRLHGLLL
jgi:gluconolactonase